MRKALLSIPAVMMVMSAVAQKAEVNVMLGTGLSYFRGNGVQSVSVISYNDKSGIGGAYNPYGTQSGLYNSASISFKRISNAHSIIGLEIGSEWLRCKTDIVRVDGNDGGTGTYQIPASGKANLTSNFLTFSPYVGYRQLLKGINIDYTTGFDLGYCLNVHETTEVRDTSGKTYSTSREKSTTSGDIRLRFQVASSIHRFGVFAGYSVGLSNYFRQNPGAGTSICKSHVVRFGLSYRINRSLPASGWMQVRRTLSGQP